MNIHIFADEHQLNEAAAHLIASQIQIKPNAILGLATGGTPIGIYKQLVTEYKRGMFSFREVRTFNLDEYVHLPIEHPESYHSYMKQHLFNHIDLPEAQCHIPNGNAKNLATECKRYDQLIKQGGQMDLQLLGLGHNGHVGFNEPAHALIKGTHIVNLTEQTRLANARFFATLAEVPSQALTMGIGTILKAKKILLVVKGSDKASIIKRALKGLITTDVPASLLQTHSNLIVLLDKAAGRELT